MLIILRSSAENQRRRNSAEKLPKAKLRCACMRLQTFAVSQLSGNLAEHLRALLADFNDAAALLKVVHAQWA